jgi:SNF2 family DNA or RNA helicase
MKNVSVAAPSNNPSVDVVGSAKAKRKNYAQPYLYVPTKAPKKDQKATPARDQIDSPPPARPLVPAPQTTSNTLNQQVQQFVAPSLANQIPYHTVHYFLYDFNLDAVPAIIKASQPHLNKKPFPDLAKLKTRITIIKPTEESPHESRVPSYLDEGVNQKLIEYLKKSQIPFEIIEEAKLETFGTASLGEIRVYIGETVNCGATSNLNVRGPVTAARENAEDDLTNYHLNHLKFIQRTLSPDLIYSENHHFSSELKSKIEKVLNANLDSRSGRGPEYHIQYEKIHHGPFTQEIRARLYLVASKKPLIAGHPASNPENPVSRYFRPQIKSKETIWNQVETPILPFEGSQEILLKDILSHYAVAHRSQFIINQHRNQLSLEYKNKKYWLVIDAPNTYPLTYPGLVLVNAKVGDIRIVRRDLDTSKLDMWLQMRYWSDLQTRLCRTITSFDRYGILVWGEKQGRLSPEQVALVHGCSKDYSKIIGRQFQNASARATNAYVGHAYSSKVVSRLLVSSLNQYAFPESGFNDPYRSTFDPLDTDSANLLTQRIAAFDIATAKLVPNADESEIYLVDSNNNRIAPKIHWSKIFPLAEVLAEMDHIRQDLEENNPGLLSQLQDGAGLEPLSPTTAAIRTQLGREENHFSDSGLREILDELVSNATQKDELFDHQVEGIKWMLKQRLFFKRGGILADDMGLGKTRQGALYVLTTQAIAEKYELTSIQPSLIVAPKSMLPSWQEEIQFWGDKWGKKIEIISSCSQFNWIKFKKTQDDPSTRKTIVITTKDTVVGCVDNFNVFHFDSILVDEAHDMKNPETALSISMKKLQADYRFCLSGTPIQNGINDALNLLNFIIPTEFHPFPKKWVETDVSDSELDDLRSRMNPYILRRTKKELSETDPRFRLPEKNITPVHFQMSDLQNKFYQMVTALQKAGTINEETGKTKQMHLRAMHTYLQEVCNDPRLLPKELYQKTLQALNLSPEELSQLVDPNYDFPKMMDLLERVKLRFPSNQRADEAHRPIVVVSRFQKTLDRIQKRLERAGYSTAIINGDMTPDGFKQIKKGFNEFKFQVLLLNLSLGQGLNLQKANLEIIFEPWWNPQKEGQAYDRIYRIGQTSEVEIVQYFVDNTVEVTNVKKTQKKKRHIFNRLIDTEHVTVPAAAGHAGVDADMPDLGDIDFSEAFQGYDPNGDAEQKKLQDEIMSLID